MGPSALSTFFGSIYIIKILPSLQTWFPWLKLQKIKRMIQNCLRNHSETIMPQFGNVPPSVLHLVTKNLPHWYLRTCTRTRNDYLKHLIITQVLQKITMTQTSRDQDTRDYGDQRHWKIDKSLEKVNFKCTENNEPRELCQPQQLQLLHKNQRHTKGVGGMGEATK